MDSLIQIVNLIVIGISCWVISGARKKKEIHKLKETLSLMLRGRLLTLNQLAYAYLQHGVQCSPLIVKVLTLGVLLKLDVRENLILFAENKESHDLTFHFPIGDKARLLIFSIDRIQYICENSHDTYFISWADATAVNIENLLETGKWQDS